MWCWGLVIAVAGGTLIEKLHLEEQMEAFIRSGRAIDLPQEELHFKDRIRYAWEQVVSTAKKVAPYVLIVGVWRRRLTKISFKSVHQKPKKQWLMRQILPINCCRIIPILPS